MRGSPPPGGPAEAWRRIAAAAAAKSRRNACPSSVLRLGLHVDDPVAAAASIRMNPDVSEINPNAAADADTAKARYVSRAAAPGRVHFEVGVRAVDVAPFAPPDRVAVSAIGALASAGCGAHVQLISPGRRSEFAHLHIVGSCIHIPLDLEVATVSIVIVRSEQAPAAVQQPSVRVQASGGSDGQGRRRRDREPEVVPVAARLEFPVRARRDRHARGGADVVPVVVPGTPASAVAAHLDPHHIGAVVRRGGFAGHGVHAGPVMVGAGARRGGQTDRLVAGCGRREPADGVRSDRRVPRGDSRVRRPVVAQDGRLGGTVAPVADRRAERERTPWSRCGGVHGGGLDHEIGRVCPRPRPPRPVRRWSSCCRHRFPRIPRRRMRRSSTSRTSARST